MNTKKSSPQDSNNIWSKLLKIAIAVLSALAAALGVQACGGL